MGVARENVSWPRSRVTTLRTAAPRPARFPPWRREDPPRISVPHYYSMCRSRRRGPSSRIRPSVQTTREKRAVCVRACNLPCCACTGARVRSRLSTSPLFFIFFPLPFSLSLLFTPLPLFPRPSRSLPLFLFAPLLRQNARVRVCEEPSSSHASPQRSMSTRCHASAQPAVTLSVSLRERGSCANGTRDEGERVLRVIPTVVELLPEPRRCPLEIFSRLTVTSGIEGIAKWLRATTR